MSGYTGEGNAVQELFRAHWEDAAPVAWPNVDFRKPTGEPWVRFSVLGSAASVASIGGPAAQYRHEGDVIVQVFTPKGEGPLRARQLADKAAGIFRGRLSGGMAFWAPRVVEVGTNDGWYQLNVICPMWRTETFAHQ